MRRQESVLLRRPVLSQKWIDIARLEFDQAILGMARYLAARMRSLIFDHT